MMTLAEFKRMLELTGSGPGNMDFIAACREMVPKLIAVAEAANKFLDIMEPDAQSDRAARSAADLFFAIDSLNQNQEVSK